MDVKAGSGVYKDAKKVWVLLSGESPGLSWRVRISRRTKACEPKMTGPGTSTALA